MSNNRHKKETSLTVHEPDSKFKKKIAEQLEQIKEARTTRNYCQMKATLVMIKMGKPDRRAAKSARTKRKVFEKNERKKTKAHDNGHMRICRVTKMTGPTTVQGLVRENEAKTGAPV